MNENIFNKKGYNTLSLLIVLGAILISGLLLLAFNIGWLNPALKSIVFLAHALCPVRGYWFCKKTKIDLSYFFIAWPVFSFATLRDCLSGDIRRSR